MRDGPGLPSVEDLHADLVEIFRRNMPEGAPLKVGHCSACGALLVAGKCIRCEEEGR